MSADTSNSYAIAFRNYLKVSDVKYCQGHVSKAAQRRIVKRDGGISRCYLVAVRGKTCRHVQGRITPAVRSAIQMNRIRQVAAAHYSVIADDVATIERIICGQARRLEPVRAGHRVWPTKDPRQQLVAVGHFAGVIAHDRIRRQELRASGPNRVRKSKRQTLVIADSPGPGKAF